MAMRKVDVYTNHVQINGESVRGVMEINMPTPSNGNSTASITLSVDGPITYHNVPYTPLPLAPTSTPYDFASDYRTLVERLTVAVQKQQLDVDVYNRLTKGLYLL
jgi:hypothetical protein